MARNVQGDQPLSPDNALTAAWGRCLPALAKLAGGHGRYHLRDYTVIYKAPGAWRARVKALDTTEQLPVILFADGDSHAGALLAADRAVRAGRWTRDRYPGGQWAR